MTVSCYNDIRNFSQIILQNPLNASAVHNIIVYRCYYQSGQLHEGFDDDGEIGAGRQLINHMKQYSMQNFVALITPKASHWRLGPKRLYLHLNFCSGEKK
ncbi:hypothetical protein KUTeg_015714 [Tegillarca granosa]|uniref:Impact N-terminal domain-containing protein n=1 Tax=Tegillarca granosa TaxID=220873 RepID=A0ABQ9ETN7_TEGGR|nr:hypothetical protein KUTeg_015714 [Tegillarca granosa]